MAVFGIDNGFDLAYGNLFALYSNMLTIGLDFGSAHFNFPMNVDLKVEDDDGPERLLSSMWGGSTLEETLNEMLARETTLDLSGKKVIPVFGYSRNAAALLIHTLTTNGGKVGLPIPSWNFWEIDELMPSKLLYFEAYG